MDLSNKKIIWIIAIIALIIIVLILAYSFSGIQTKEGKVILSKEELIKAKIGEFSIKEESDYQGGTIIKTLSNQGEASREYTFFYKDKQLQRLPDQYVIDLAKAQLSDAEKQNKMVSFKYQEEYNTNAPDEKGENIIYKNVFLMTNELPESEWVENAMYMNGPAKYQVVVVDEFGNLLFKFLSSQIL